MNTWWMATWLLAQPVAEPHAEDPQSDPVVQSVSEVPPEPQTDISTDAGASATAGTASEAQTSTSSAPEANVGASTAPPPASDPKAGNGFSYTRHTDPSKVYEGGMKWTFGSEGQHSVRLINWHQIWMRYTENNPGSQVQGEDRRHQFDIGIRRSRLLLVAEFGGRFQILTHIGINNQTFNNARKPQVFVHEATGQVRAFREYLYVGTGLHYWHGISRMTNASTLNFLAIDAPILNWPSIERTDQFARNLGVYIKGKINLFDYRLALNKPFAVGTGAEEELPTTATAVDNPRSNSVSLAGYFMLQFLEKESNALPYTVGSYLGAKKVANLGFGFQWQNDAVWWLEGDSPRAQDSGQLGVDVFVDLPMPKELGAITFYGAYYYYNFGPDYLRMLGIMNVATGGSTLNGPGNAYPVIGTGHHGFLQLGYVLPWRGMGLHRLQPYFSSQISGFDALDAPAFIPEVGLNWHLLGHNFKLTAAYRNRPVYADRDGEALVDTRRSELIVQTHVFF